MVIVVIAAIVVDLLYRRYGINLANCVSVYRCCRDTGRSDKRNANCGKSCQNAHSYFRHYFSPFGFRYLKLSPFVTLGPLIQINAAMVGLLNL